MSKITRQTFLQFGINANTASDVCEFGTPATGSPVYTGNIATLQANSAWLAGWAAETVASNRPFLEDMNAMSIVFAYMLAYMFEMGIPEYDSGTTYYTNSIVQYSGVLYTSLTDSNTGNTPTVGANWKLTIQSVSGILGAWTSESFTTIYQAATDGFVCADVTNNASGGFGLYGVTDSSASPSTQRASQTGDAPNTTELSIMMPVRKNDYWEVTTSGTISLSSLYFIALGS